MAVRDIVLHPDERLRETCVEVETVDDEVKALVDDLVDTMYDAPGIGLAAPQVGSNLRVLVVDIREPEEEGTGSDTPGALHVLVNPRIVERDGHIVWEEGCLSVPGVYEDVKRSNHIVVEAFGRDGQPIRIDAKGLLAVCIQHEMDHLEGIMFLDHLSRLKLRMATKTYKRTRADYLQQKEARQQAEAQSALLPA